MRGRGGLAALLMAATVPIAARHFALTILTAGKSFQYVSDLTAIGPRLTGTPAYQRAAEWAAGQFRAAGLTRVSFEPFPIEHGWERGPARARLLSPIEQPIHIESIGWTPSTPDGGVEGDVVEIDDIALDAIAAHPSLRGRIALLPAAEPPGDPETVAAMRRAADAKLHDAGVRAVLFPESGADNLLSARGHGFGTAIGLVPAAQLGRDDAQAIRQLLRRGPVRIALEMRNRITSGAVDVNNVIAEILGRERPDEWVIVGAHLDSWDFGTGAQDNATGVAMVLDAARAIAALGQPPRRSIRFALWGGEEQGQIGSTAWTRAHAFELDRVVAILNTDAGSGRVVGWTAPGRGDVVNATRRLTQAVLEELGAVTFDRSLRYAFQSDGAPFILAGIPTLDLNADDSTYEEIHHKTTDTIERVDAGHLATGAATVAATAYEVADAPARIAPRLDRRAVERMRTKGE
jgi:carboxypeptidase Q